jgi:hypothetical protein
MKADDPGFLKAVAISRTGGCAALQDGNQSELVVIFGKTLRLFYPESAEV